MSTGGGIILELRGLTVEYPSAGGFLAARRPPVRVLDDVSLSVEKGRTLGLVGESGSGKTTIARAIMGLAPVAAGKILYDGADLAGLSWAEFLPYRQKIQMVFQDPYGSLNPRHTIQQILSEPLEIHFTLTAAERRDRVAGLLRKVGLDPSSMNRRPREFSGGQRQRIGIARALAVEPEIILCDECVSALDVSIQAQVINLLQDLQEELGLTYLFIGHDLAVVEHISDTIAVLHHGRLVESGPAEQIIHHPRHDYTRRLLDAVPSL